MTAPTVFAAVFVALYVAHDVGDHWLQTHWQACSKGRLDGVGRAACTQHVVNLATLQTVTVLAVGALLHLHLSAGRVAAGIAVNAVSHWWIDRRYTLAALARFAERAGINGKATFAALGAPRAGRDDNPTPVTGAYLLDQSWHRAWLLVTALLIAA